MKKIVFGLLILSGIFNTVSSQNLLSPVWKIITSNSVAGAGEKVDDNSWQYVNLMLSWERQGFSWQSGDCTLENEFSFQGTAKKYRLSFSLQCDVNKIFVNDVYIGGNIPNSFWVNRGHETTLPVPDSCLHSGEINKIEFQVSNLSYTGGHSFNYCQLIPEAYEKATSVELSFPVADHLFSTGDDSINMNITIESANSGKLNLFIRNDYSDTIAIEHEFIKAGENCLSFDLKKYKLQPGFYECIAVVSNGAYAGDVAWFALSPEQIACSAAPVSEFDAYWEKALLELKTVSPNFKMHRVDSLCSETRDGFIVEMQSTGDVTLRGYYFVPKTPGKHPVVLHLPGYGYGFNHLDGFINREGDMAELALCVRGHGISADKFNPWNDMTLWAYKICDEDENVYRNMYLDCVRAVDFLLSREEIDTAMIGVAGGSQGGGLAIATAGLCPGNIHACAFFDPFPCDTRHHLEIRTMVRGELTSFTKYYDSSCTFEKVLEVQDYVDTKNFAAKITCPVYFVTSLFDDDVPPHMGFAAYNRIKSEKKFRIYPDDSHLAESNQYDGLFVFIQEQFEVLKAEKKMQQAIIN